MRWKIHTKFDKCSVLTEFDIIEEMKILSWPKFSKNHLRSGYTAEGKTSIRADSTDNHTFKMGKTKIQTVRTWSKLHTR